MKTEKLKQNVKGYVHQFEDGGLRLLRKGQKGVIHAIFSRFGLVLILLLLQVGLLFSIFRWFGNLWPHYFGGSVVVTSAMVIYLLNSKMDNSAKITWMVVVAIAPVVGIPMFFYVKSNFGHNILRKRLLELEDQLRGWLPQSQKAVEQLKALEPGAASLAKYLYGRGGSLRGLSAGRRAGGRDGLYRPAQPGQGLHPHYDPLPHSGRRTGDRPEICR